MGKDEGTGSVTEEPELPLAEPCDHKNYTDCPHNSEEPFNLAMYNMLMADSRRQNDIAERARTWLLRINEWYAYVMIGLLALYVFYAFASHNSKTKARIYRLEHATGL